MQFEKIVFWSDSTITLHWINASPHSLKPFVANRVAEIQSVIESHEWRHVRSHDNPADALSRGQLPADFVNNITWKTGPQWLSHEEETWPQTKIPGLTDELPDVRKNICLLSKTSQDGTSKRKNSAKIVDAEFEIFKRFSSFIKLKRFVALAVYLKPGKAYTKKLEPTDLINAEKIIIKHLQAVYFKKEIYNLTIKNDLKKTSKLLPLSPFLDEDGVLRVGGRLKNAELLYSQQHPILLPQSTHVTELIIRECHTQNHHTGIQSTLCALRQKYWLLDGRNQVRQIVKNCVQCFRANPPTIEYLMGELPSVRVTQARVFSNVGIDYCGPFFIKEKKHRNTKKIKVYVAVFVCMAVKAVHLELVSDLTTEGFLAALRRFLSRRGKPKNIYSDNGKNFVGAKNELFEIYALFESENHKNKVNNFLIEQEISWHFIPPHSPHFGGLWESTVKMFKHHLKRVVSDLLFTFEEFNTFVIEIEAILNSRPLTPLSSDPNDPPVLTPAHILIGDSLTSLPEADFRTTPSNKLSHWQHIQKVRQHFWTRWYKEYINELNIRHKWTTGEHSMKENAIVLLKEDNLPSMQWALGRVVQTHPGADGIIRTVTVKTAKSEFKRSVKKLALLPIKDNYIKDFKK